MNVGDLTVKVNVEIDADMKEQIRQIVREEMDAKIKELESDLALCKQQMAQALGSIGEQLSAELEKLMKETEESYTKAAIDMINSQGYNT